MKYQLLFIINICEENQLFMFDLEILLKKKPPSHDEKFHGNREGGQKNIFIPLPPKIFLKVMELCLKTLPLIMEMWRGGGGQNKLFIPPHQIFLEVMEQCSKTTINARLFCLFLLCTLCCAVLGNVARGALGTVQGLTFYCSKDN